MGTLELLALIFGITGIILTIKESIWCWLADIISVAIQGYVCYKANLLGDSSLQIFYFISGIYGWVYWKKNYSINFKVSNMGNKNWAYVILSVIILSLILYPILAYFKSDRLIIESVLTAASLVCTYMMAKKWLENWFFWILIDLSYVYLYYVQGLHTMSILFIIYSSMAYYGYYTWKKQLKK